MTKKLSLNQKLAAITGLAPLSLVVNGADITGSLPANYQLVDVSLCREFADARIAAGPRERVAVGKNTSMFRNLPDALDQDPKFQGRTGPLQAVSSAFDGVVTALFEAATKPGTVVMHTYESGGDGWNPSVPLTQFLEFGTTGKKSGWVPVPEKRQQEIQRLLYV